MTLDAARTDEIRSRVAKRLVITQGSLITSSVGRAARILLGVGRGSTLALKRALYRGPVADSEAVSAFVASFGQLKGVTMKVGQLLSFVDVGLPDDVRAALSALQTHAQPMPFQRVRAILEEELGAPARELVQAMRPEPIAAASIGQVHASTLPDGTRVAVKVLYPEVADAIARDFGPATVGGRLASWIDPTSRVDAFVAEVRARLLEECDYQAEASRQEQFAELFAGHANVLVPAVHRGHSSRRVLTTTLVDGVHLDAWLASGPAAEERNRAAETLFDFYLGPLFRNGLYHCDPHPGNYLFTADGRIAFLDFGCTREFDPGFVAHLASLTLAVRAGDGDLIHGALVSLGVLRAGQPYDPSMRWLVAALYGPLLRDEVVRFTLDPGLSLRDMLRKRRQASGLVLSGELLFLLRTFLGLSSVLARLDARANWHQLLERLLAVRLRPASYDVVLLDAGDGVIEVLRQIRDATGMDIRKVKDLIDATPKAIRQSVGHAEAEALRLRLEKVGARVEVKRVE